TDTPADFTATPPPTTPPANPPPPPSWYVYSINNTTTINGQPCWLDYPGFALDSKALYITGNMFSFRRGFQDTRLLIVNKSNYASMRYNPGQLAGVTNTFTLQPAHMYGNAPTNVGTFLVSWNGNNRLSVIRVNNPLNNPTFTNQFISTGNIGGGSGSSP